MPIHLIIHDECHSISNKTRMFYKYIMEKYETISCLGFSATPNLIKPFDKIISSYSFMSITIWLF